MSSRHASQSWPTHAMHDTSTAPQHAQGLPGVTDHANFKSPLVWDVFAISTYLTISVVFFIVGLVPDVAALRDHATGSKRKIYAVLSLGWEGSDQQWRHYRRGYGLLAALATPLVLSVHSVVSFDFARGARTVGFLRRQQPFMLLRALGRMVSNDLAVDLGTANTLVYVRGEGIVLNEPSVVAITRKDRSLLAVGHEAKAMLGCAPDSIQVLRPLRHGVIADFDTTEKLLHYIISAVLVGAGGASRADGTRDTPWHESGLTLAGATAYVPRAVRFDPGRPTAEMFRTQEGEMEGEIGNAAGMIWQYLNEHGQTTLGELRQGTKLSDQLLLLGVGWLAREGKVSMVQPGRTVKVSLREG